jgi:hypothetical protein
VQERWKHLPPGYRQLTGAGRSREGDIRWLGDVKQWHEVLGNEIGKSPDDEVYVFATPDKVKGAPPLYRPVKDGAIRKQGMLMWIPHEGVLKGTWVELTKAGLGSEAHSLVEPEPPFGWSWLETHQIIQDTDRVYKKTEDRTEQRWVDGSIIGERVPKHYQFIRRNKDWPGDREREAQESNYTEWGSF